MSPDSANGQRHVIVVGGGFAGVGCVRRLAGRDGVRVTLVDRNNYHQFQPLLYQVATSQLAPSDIAYSLRKLFADEQNVDVKLAEVASIDPATRSVTTTAGDRITGDALVLAAGSQPNFFHTPGAAEHALPLYSLDDATRLFFFVPSSLRGAPRPPAAAHPRRVRGRRPRPVADRAGCAELRRRRRRSHRRRGGGRARGPHPRH